MNTVIEVCAGSFEDALAAQQGGADRIELNSALFMGGLTPSLGTLLLTKQSVHLPVVVMIRPRGGGFHYSSMEKKVIWQDTKLMLENGADGIAFGCLDEQGNIDEEFCSKLVELIHSYGKEAVFHRAFDCVLDPFLAMELLISMDVDRVLSSGLEATAPEGKELLKQLQFRYGNQIELLAGSGIHADNVIEFMKDTGIRQVHSSCKGWMYDGTAVKNHVSYAYASSNHACEYDVVSKKVVCRLVEIIQKYEVKIE